MTRQIEGLFYDARFAIRGLRRDRAFTIAAIAMLAFTIGLNVTVFAVSRAALFGGFPGVKENGRLVYMQEKHPRGCCISYPDFRDWKAQAVSFEDMAFVAGKGITIGERQGERPLETWAVPVTTNLFGMLGVAPALGRDFDESDESAEAQRVAILSHSFWENRFGKRGDIVGHMIRIDGAPVRVIGVMPQRFGFPAETNLWVPLERTAALLQRAPSAYLAVGRLKETATVESARAEIETINRRLAAEYPDTNRDVVPRVENHAQFFLGPDARMIYGSAWVAAGFVLLIACANLANLTLARTLGRSRELTTRIALGAGRWRIVRQLLAESLMLTSIGGILGWWIAKWSVRTWETATADPYRILDYTLDSGVAAYLCAISILAAILFMLAPIGRIFQIDVNSGLKSDARGATRGPKGKRLSAALVTIQMALAIVLLSGAGVLVRSFLKLVTADTGVTGPEKVLIGTVRLPRYKYSTPESRIAFFDSLRMQAMAIPGVESESIASTVPVNLPASVPFDLETALDTGTQSVMAIGSNPDYFRAVGAAIVNGRDFKDTDQPGAQPVVIVNRSFAAKYWPGQNALGKRIRLFDSWRTVAGVASNIMQGDPTRQSFLPIVYFPFRQNPGSGAVFFVRTRGPAEQLAAAVRAEVEKLDPDLVLEDFTTLKNSFAFRADRMDVEHVEMGKHATVAPIFAGIALLLAAIGLYAVVAHSVNQRTKEIGVRMALGAAVEDIRGMVFREGMLPVAVGLVAGLAISFGVNRILQSQLVGVSPYDPATMILAPVMLILVALLGCQIPARRAMGVDPAAALRQD